LVLLGKGVVLVWNDVVPEGRDAFYAWHNKEHIPERMSLKGFQRGRRFICRDHSPEWLTFYEAEDLKVLVGSEYLDRLNHPTEATVRCVQLFRNTARSVCTVSYSEGVGTGGYILAARFDVRAEKIDELETYLREVFLPGLLSQSEIAAAHLVVANDAASNVETTEAKERRFVVPKRVLLVETISAAAAVEASAAICSTALMQRGIMDLDVGGVYSLEISQMSK